jgi:electron transfer flavoprotein alpha subunit
MTAQGGILVFSEDQAVARELLGKARQVANGQGLVVSMAVLGESGPADGAEFAAWGVDTVYSVASPHLAGFNPESYTDALAAVLEQVQPNLVLVGATKQGLEVASRVCERLDLGCASWGVDFEIEPAGKEVTVRCMIFSGVGTVTYKVRSRPAVATVNPGVFSPVESSERAVAVTPVSVEIEPPLLAVLEENEKMAAGRRLEDAPVIVDVGMGVNEREDLGMIEELAGLLKGQVACTRPVSSDRDWFPEWLGLSGAQLSPELCITLGVSGAIQHVIGIRDSKLIVAVDKDENSAMLMQADYGVKADLYEFVPALIEAIKARRISLA